MCHNYECIEEEEALETDDGDDEPEYEVAVFCC